jgi:hypothetical protein
MLKTCNLKIVDYGGTVRYLSSSLGIGNLERKILGTKRLLIGSSLPPRQLETKSVLPKYLTI